MMIQIEEEAMSPTFSSFTRHSIFFEEREVYLFFCLNQDHLTKNKKVDCLTTLHCIINTIQRLSRAKDPLNCFECHQIAPFKCGEDSAAIHPELVRWLVVKISNYHFLMLTTTRLRR